MSARPAVAVGAAVLAIVAVVWLAVAVSDNVKGSPFQSCKEAQQAGAPLPLHNGDPGWNPKLDRDKDGAAC